MPVQKDPAVGLNAAVAEVLNGERGAADMSYEDLAAKSCISRSSLIRMLANKSRHIDVASLATLASVFRMTPLEVVSAAQARMDRPEPTPAQKAAARGVKKSMKKPGVSPVTKVKKSG